jgi:polyribonucleotide nucleotidyltransferase
MFDVHKVNAQLGDHDITIETGRIARQASGSVVISCGDSVVLVTAVAKPHRDDAHFLPLVVDYIEKQYAGGTIPGGFFKREGKPSDLEILVARLTDRPIRPLFPDGYKGDTQIIATVLSHDMEHDTDVMCITGASAALTLSHAPFKGPIAGVRVCRVDGDLHANPTRQQRERADLDIIMACSRDAIVMVEGEADEVPEDEMLDALNFGFESVQRLIDAQLDLQEVAGKEKITFESPAPDEAITDRVAELTEDKMVEALTVPTKFERYGALDALKAEVVEELAEEFEGQESDIKDAFDNRKSQVARDLALNDGKRIDGRGFKQVRPIDVEAGLLPRTHGSSLFTRGETQAIVTTTLGTGRDARLIDAVTGKEDLNFMLHYNFPPFSVGEVKMLRSTSRRETGHGWLAHKAIESVIPPFAQFPYVVRVVSEVTESNGSSSMASVCGASMALMDAGVPIRSAVAGIAMGLMSEGDDYVILSDILGDEDHLGDMDFKVAGTREGITALQMDIKVQGLTREILSEAMEQARAGRLHILNEMAKAIGEPRAELKDFAPRITTIHISPDRIRDVIGSGGKTIRSIAEKTGCQVDVEDDGSVNISSSSREATQEAIDIIEALTAEPVTGEIYLGSVAKVTDFGAFVTILPGLDGLLHISEISEERIDKVEDVVREGDEVIVKCLAVERGGKIRLSRKEALGQKPNVIATQLDL